MNTLWTFECGHLVARNLAGAVLHVWQADEAMGGPLADLLNHTPDLSQKLLPQWYTRVPVDSRAQVLSDLHPA